VATTLTHRINLLCGDGLAAFRARLSTLAEPDVYAGGLESAVTTMPRHPSVLTEGSSVDIVAFGTCGGYGPPRLTLSVTMVRGHHAWPRDVFWDEAHAWAEAIAEPPLTVAGLTGSQETADGMVFHYRLRVATGADPVPRLSAVRPSGTAAVIRASPGFRST
jgi:hypothetical protein